MSNKIRKGLWSLVGVHFIFLIFVLTFVCEIREYMRNSRQILKISQEIIHANFTELVQLKIERHERMQREIDKALNEIEAIMGERINHE